MASFKFSRPLGTEDVTPKDICKWHTVEKKMRRVAESFGFQEMRVPTFEQTSLFLRSVGETTDVVQKEMYTVKARETAYALRPEGTAGIMRGIIQNGMLNDPLPIKVYYILSCFRHERPQAGRLREFHQFGVELVGSAGPESDAEVILLAKNALDSLGLLNIDLHLNSIGCPVCRKQYYDALREYFAPHKNKLCKTCQERLQKNPMRILDCKEETCAALAKDAPLVLDYLCEECRTHFDALQTLLQDMRIEFAVDPKIVRGLDYYTKTVFEFISNDIGAKGTVCAGGRYDGLIAELGGKPTPAMGFGLGLERLILTMSEQRCAFEKAGKCDLYIAPMDSESMTLTIELATRIRNAPWGYRVEYDLMRRGLKAQLRYANKLGARFLIVLGEKERTAKSAMVKNMHTGQETVFSLEDMAHTANAFHELAEVFRLEEYEKTAKEVKRGVTLSEAALDLEEKR